jgi:thiamine biosynthesis protein ThiI
MNFLSLVSSGIDSPVATYLFCNIAENMILLHADYRPYTDDRELNKFKSLSKHLKKITGVKLKPIIIPHGDNLSIYKKNCDNKYTCIFCKRMLLRYADKVAEEEKSRAIIMGDSLGQVASQTLINLKVIENSVRIPILRPLIGLDKEEIIKIAKKIGTYNLSISESDGCSAVPKKPSTKTITDRFLIEENKLDIQKMVKNSVLKKQVLTL